MLVHLFVFFHCLSLSHPLLILLPLCPLVYISLSSPSTPLSSLYPSPLFSPFPSPPPSSFPHPPSLSLLGSYLIFECLLSEITVLPLVGDTWSIRLTNVIFLMETLAGFCAKHCGHWGQMCSNAISCVAKRSVNWVIVHRYISTMSL